MRAPMENIASNAESYNGLTVLLVRGTEGVNKK
jgi:hypothetical protein